MIIATIVLLLPIIIKQYYTVHENSSLKNKISKSVINDHSDVYEYIFCKISYGRFTSVLYPKIASFLSELLSHILHNVWYKEQ